MALTLLIIPLIGFAAIKDWDYLPYVSYYDQYPGEVIKEGQNFDLLLNLWEKPKSLQELKLSGFNMEAVDTVRLINQGMIYRNDGIYYSAIPFIDSLANENLRYMARIIATTIINDTEQERNDFFSVLDSAGYRESAFPLVHSLVFDDIIWKNIGVSHENTTICPVDSMTWSGVFYFYRPEDSNVYGTNGMGLDEKHKFKFAWGNNSNAYLCTVFVKTHILNGLRNFMKGEDLTEEMLLDCKRFGVIDENNRLTIPILDGNDEISNAANMWSKAAADAFTQHFKGEDIAKTIGWNCRYNEAALKVILYHEVLTQIAQILDETGILPIPEVLTSEIPADKKHTANVSYIINR
ncbi:MAG: hypothetical protein K2M00_09590 [Muribaculaceae bacterium]|nr:hypothetical protein [Muribaculaceae bacterium]